MLPIKFAGFSYKRPARCFGLQPENIHSSDFYPFSIIRQLDKLFERFMPRFSQFVVLCVLARYRPPLSGDDFPMLHPDRVDDIWVMTGQDKLKIPTIR